MSLIVLADHLPAILSDFPGSSLVYAFGSQVKGDVGPMSDYDLAILDESGQGELDVQARFQHTVSILMDTQRVDVVLIHRVPIEMAYHIIASGKLLYQRTIYARVEFESQVLGKYGDYLPTLRAFQQQTLHGDAHAKRVQRYREALRRTQLGELGVIQAEFPRRLAPLAGFRNALIHEYLMIDWDQVYKGLQNLDDLKLFVKEIQTWLSKKQIGLYNDN